MDQKWIFLIANGFGLLSTLCFIISFQIKSKKKLFIVQSIANIFYGIQFYMLGAYGGLFNMWMQIFRNIFLIKKNEWKWLQWKGMATLLCVPSLIHLIMTWSGPMDLLPFIAYVGGTYCYWTSNATILRLSEIFCIAPAWLTYDFLNRAYGGVINELVILASVIISIVRFGWKGLDDPDFNK